MAAFALLDARLTINSVNFHTLSMIKSVSLAVNVNELDPTAMGDTWVEKLGGLKSGTLAIDFIDDYAASSVDQTLWPLLGTVTTFTLRPTSAAISTTNPEYQGSVLISAHNVGGGVGELAMKSGMSFPTSGTVTRATA